MQIVNIYNQIRGELRFYVNSCTVPTKRLELF